MYKISCSLPGGIETKIKDLKSQRRVIFDKCLIVVDIKYQNNTNKTFFFPYFLEGNRNNMLRNLEINKKRKVNKNATLIIKSATSVS